MTVSMERSSNLDQAVNRGFGAPRLVAGLNEGAMYFANSRPNSSLKSVVGIVRLRHAKVRSPYRRQTLTARRAQRRMGHNHSLPHPVRPDRLRLVPYAP